MIDPQPFSEEEDRASELGVRSACRGRRERQFYFGLAGTNSTDGHAAIEFFDPNKEQFLEYDVVKLVYELANPKKPVVAWLSIAADGRQARPADAARCASRGWSTTRHSSCSTCARSIAAATRIDPDVNVLVLVHPKRSARRDPVRHRPVRAARRPHPAVRRSARRSRRKRRDPRIPMARNGRRQVLAPGAAAGRLGRRLQSRQRWCRSRPCAVGNRCARARSRSRTPGCPGPGPERASADDVVTAGLSNVNVAMAGYAQARSRARRSASSRCCNRAPRPSCCRSSASACCMDPGTPASMASSATGERYTLAARVSGRVQAAFPHGPPAGVTLPAGRERLKTSLPNAPATSSCSPTSTCCPITCGCGSRTSSASSSRRPGPVTATWCRTSSTTSQAAPTSSACAAAPPSRGRSSAWRSCGARPMSASTPRSRNSSSSCARRRRS